MTKRYFVIETTYTPAAATAKGKTKAYRRVEINGGAKGEKEALAYAREQAGRFQHSPDVADVRVFEADEFEYAELRGREVA